MKRVLKYLALVSFLVAATAYSANPIGFERWTKADETLLMFDRDCKSLVNSYSHDNFFGPYNSKNDSNKNFRLTDIEVRIDPYSGNLKFDAIAVSNTKHFLSKSWLVCDTDKAWLDSLVTTKKVTLLDVEKYVVEGKIHWAAIVQLTPFPVETKLVTNLTINEINAVAEEGVWRVLDIDMYSGTLLACHTWKPGDAACGHPPNTFSAVLVKNEGLNYVDWILDEYTGDEENGPGDTPSKIGTNYQLVDRELTRLGLAYNNYDPTKWESAMLFVKRANQYKTFEVQTQNDVFANSVFSPKVVDLEWYTDPDEFPAGFVQKWYTVNAQLLF